MVRKWTLHAYDVAAVFLGNGYDSDAAEISFLDWDERLSLDDPAPDTGSEIQAQIETLATNLAHLRSFGQPSLELAVA
jgi:hypothetical protein